MNILILTGKFGMGHWSASQSLRQQLLHSFPDARVEVEDFLTYAMPNLAETMYKGFNMVVTYGSHLFNAYYKITAMGHPDARPPFEGLLLDKLAELLYQSKPDAVIATHPLCAQLVSRLKEQARTKGTFGLDLPLITCVTDVSSHPEWINQNTDCYLVASREVRQELVKKGVEASLICVTGIPVREEFRHLEHCGMNEQATVENEDCSMNDAEPESAKGRTGYSVNDVEPGSAKHRMDFAGSESAKSGENFVKCSVGTENTKVKEPSANDCYRMGDASLLSYGVENEEVLRSKKQEEGESLSWASYDKKGAVVNKYMLSDSCGKINTQVKYLSLFPFIAAVVAEQGKAQGKGKSKAKQSSEQNPGQSIIVPKDNRKEKRREVLIMGGGLGLLPKSEDFYDALNCLPDTHITIITGRNTKLRKRLEGRKCLEEDNRQDRHKHRCWENIEVVGYTNQVWEYMSRADLIVTKPGGITLFETIFAQVPILTWPPTLQQEKGNACWLMEEGIGWVAKKKNCVEEIREILMDEERLSRARYRMGRLKEQMRAESLDGLMEVIANSQREAV